MKTLNLDWVKFADRLQLWVMLSVPARVDLLELKDGQWLPRQLFSVEEEKILMSEMLLRLSPNGKQVGITELGKPFFHALRSMKECLLPRDSNVDDLLKYLEKHFHPQEYEALLTAPTKKKKRNDYEQPLVEAWVRQITACKSVEDARQWERIHLPPEQTKPTPQDPAPFFDDPDVLHALQRLLNEANKWRGPAVLRDIAAALPNVAPKIINRAVMAGVRYLLLFVSMDGPSLEPIIGLWPAIIHQRIESNIAMPSPVKPQETFHAPFLVEDMLNTLVAASGEPLRLLANNYGLYQKDLDRLAQGNLPMPGWLADKSAGEHESRVYAAIHACRNLKLLKEVTDDRRRRCYDITPAGRDWLGLEMKERLRALIEPWRRLPEKKKKVKYRHAQLDAMTSEAYDLVMGHDSKSPWIPESIGYGFSGLEKVDFRAAFIDCLLQEDREAFFPYSELLQYHCRANNPLLGKRVKGSYGPTPRCYHYGRNKQGETALREDWYQALGTMIEKTMMPLGAVEFGNTKGQYSLRLHSIGRYMLGLDDDFSLDTRPQGDVIIQPNFEVVFLGHAPAAEAVLGRLGQRIGHGMGALFRLTRESILTAAAAGIRADDALNQLTQISSKPLPDNVRREVAGWFATTAMIQLRHTWIVEAPDEPTALRVLAAAGKEARQLTPTLLELPGAKSKKTELARKLKKQGVFIM